MASGGRRLRTARSAPLKLPHFMSILSTVTALPGEPDRLPIPRHQESCSKSKNGRSMNILNTDYATGPSARLSSADGLKTLRIVLLTRALTIGGAQRQLIYL